MNVGAREVLYDPDRLTLVACSQPLGSPARFRWTHSLFGGLIRRVFYPAAGPRRAKATQIPNSVSHSTFGKYAACGCGSRVRLP